MLNKFKKIFSSNKNQIVPVNNNVALKKLNSVSNVIPAPDALSFFNELQNAYTTHRQTEVQIRTIEAQRDVLITEIQNRYELYHKVFDNIFEERRMSIDKSFEIIDQGLRENDRELVNIGMQGLSKIVSSSPFANVEQLTNLIESGQKIQI